MNRTMSKSQKVAQKLRALMVAANEPATVAVPAMAALLEDYGVEPADALDIATAAYFEAGKPTLHEASAIRQAIQDGKIKVDSTTGVLIDPQTGQMVHSTKLERRFNNVQVQRRIMQEWNTLGNTASPSERRAIVSRYQFLCSLRTDLRTIYA